MCHPVEELTVPVPVEQTLVLAPLPVARRDVEGEAADRPGARLCALLLLLEALLDWPHAELPTGPTAHARPQPVDLHLHI